MAASPRAQLTSLQAGRAVAAIFVVIFHLNAFYLPQRIYEGETLSMAAGMGYAGVEYFFALSGFLMVYAHAKDFGKPERLMNFAERRITRIYPVYWLILLGLVAAYLAVPALAPEGGLTVSRVLANLSLMPLEETAILEVAWTLQYEMVFYVLFATLILSPRIGAAVLSVWFAGCVLALTVLKTEFPLGFLFAPYNFIFFAGMAGAWLYTKLPSPAAILAVLAGAATFFGAGLSDVYGAWPFGAGWRTVALGAGAALLITGLAGLEHRGHFRAPRFLVSIGDASYSLYLLHIPLLALASKVVVAAGLNLLIGVWAMAALLTAGCIVVSLVFYKRVERPLVTALQSKRRPAGAMPASTPPAPLRALLRGTPSGDNRPLARPMRSFPRRKKRPAGL
jgi:exopolysaccharide production protein ExoZ